MAETMTRGRVRVEHGRKRVRAYLGGELAADTTSPLLVWEVPYYPAYYIPAGDIRADLVPTGTTDHSPSRGDAEIFDCARRPAPHRRRRAVTRARRSRSCATRCAWTGMPWTSGWRRTSPSTPIPATLTPGWTFWPARGTSGSRSTASPSPTPRQPRILFETGLPPRYYLPLADVRLDLLRPSATQSHCPYKGTASYWALDAGAGVHEDFVWIYRSPLAESQKIAGLACFYNEKVDLYLDGVLQQRPHTKFS